MTRADLNGLAATLAVVVAVTLLSLPQMSCSGAADATITPANAPQVQSVPVRVVAVERKLLKRTLDLGGVAEAARSARLAPMAQGVVRRLPVELGQTVTKGQLLAELDSDTLRLQVAAATRTVDLGRLQLTDAEREHARAVDLHSQGALPQQTLDKAELGLELARAQVAQAEASLAVVADQLSNSRLVAPFAGTVTTVALEEGEFFVPMAGLGGPPVLIGIDALDPIRLDVHIPDVDLSRVAAGMDVAITTEAWPDREFVGTVALVNAAADAGSRTFLVRIAIDNPEHALRPGLFVTAHIAVEQQDDALVVPSVAINNVHDDPYVMVREGDRAKRIKVQLGLQGNDGWAVEGLADGAEVIVEGQFGLPDGSPIRVLK